MYAMIATCPVCKKRVQWDSEKMGSMLPTHQDDLAKTESCPGAGQEGEEPRVFAAVPVPISRGFVRFSGYGD